MGSNADFVLDPLNTVLVYFETKHQSAYIYDSLHNKQLPQIAVDSIQLLELSLLMSMLFSQKQVAESFSYYERNILLQLNSFDCGISVIMYAKYLFQRKELSTPYQYRIERITCMKH